MSEAHGTTTPSAIRYPGRTANQRQSLVGRDPRAARGMAFDRRARAGGFTLTPEMVRKFEPPPVALEADATYVEIVCRRKALELRCIVLRATGTTSGRPCGFSHVRGAL